MKRTVRFVGDEYGTIGTTAADIRTYVERNYRSYGREHARISETRSRAGGAFG